MVCARTLLDAVVVASMASDINVGQGDQNIVSEFCHLLEKSKQLFNGLRDLPQHGHRQWKAYFGRTFEVYTKLWRFQQQHRQKLDELYGLKRWQIGEVASKIGQLYHHYYLRTSDLHYLSESFAFFSAVRTRDYYSKANKEEKPDLMIKKLRYYARFILVCLLLRKMKLVNELIREFSKQVDEYIDIYDADDHSGWIMVIREMKDFVDGDSICEIVDCDTPHIYASKRLNTLNTPRVDRYESSHLQLSEVLIIGNCYDQIRFSELSLDMYRMLQTFERDPRGQMLNSRNSRLSVADGLENGISASYPLDVPEVTNPHKYLLYKPTFSQFNTYIATAFKDLPPTGVLLLYISAEGIRAPTVKNNESNIGAAGYDYGGVVTNNRHEQEFSVKPKSSNFKEPHCIHPGDLLLYTRKPLFLIVDSDNSTTFRVKISLFYIISLILLHIIVEVEIHTNYILLSGYLVRI
ncbi:Protein SCAI isoform 2 [Schistosoma japonicum]|uniref:Protein SCAI isoform 2 n=1 Tax=Schistosoma japonicum TaxID=6182 RepID=A0A4Z2CZK1_SCHJA|nr:Protein SCAI [Schistosoma japonicum]TNN09672.1 Protein SCAI isoform 2 [Schistosoma japonicum]